MAAQGDREPLLTWPALTLALSIPLFYWLQTQVYDIDSLYRDYGLVPYDVEQGEYLGLFTSLLLHGNWAHALMNAAFALFFGLPVSRLMGSSWNQGIAYVLLYIVCGVVANLAYCLLHPGSFQPLVGASGAVSGLMGAATRLFRTRGIMGPVLSTVVVLLGAALVAINLFFGWVANTSGEPGLPTAWEAHLAGFFMGLVLIGPWAALFGKRSIDEANRLPPLAPRPGEVWQPVAAAPEPEPAPALPSEAAPEPEPPASEAPPPELKPLH